MKTIILFFIFGSILLLSCSKDSSTNNDNLYKSDGVITGYDYRKCICCGGWFIVIQDSTYRFKEIPKDGILYLNNETFPLTVELDWKKSTEPCIGDEITVVRIRKKK